MTKFKRDFKVPLSILLLILIDQLIKVYISNNLMDQNYYIFYNLVSFKPIINIHYSWLNSLSNLGIGFLPHVIINIVVLIVAIILFDFLKQNFKDNKIINIVFITLLAGAICSLIDKVLWGGSLDYIYLKGLFIFDLKDVYLTMSEVILIISLLFNHKGFRNKFEKISYSKFRLYIKAKYLKS